MCKDQDMNRAQRRNQTRPKSNMRKSGLAYLTAAGLAGGSLGLVSPANAAALSLTADSCETINSQLGLLVSEADGGTLNMNYSGECALDAGFYFRGNVVLNGPTSGDLTLQVPTGRSYGLGTNSELNIKDLKFTAPQGMGIAQTILELGESSTTTLENVVLLDSLLNSAAIYAEGNLTVVDSTFTNLESLSGGGAIFGTMDSTLNISNSTFTGNQASDGASGGAIYAAGELNITDSTFVENVASDIGGAIYAEWPVSRKISNSTFVGNEADTAAAIYFSEGGVVSNSTFWNNGDADTFTLGANQTDTYFFANILANDTPSTVKLINPTENITDLGANLYTDGSFDDNTDGEGSSKLVIVPELKLSALASANADSTKTVAIAADSVAYDYYTADSDGINPTAGGVLITLLAADDQKGADRPLNNGYDVGAYESGEKPDPSPSETPETTETEDSESLADTGLETTANSLGLIGVGLAAMLGGSIGLVIRRRKV